MGEVWPGRRCYGMLRFERAHMTLLAFSYEVEGRYVFQICRFLVWVRNHLL
jgi:hypothetical protein